ncbi:uncharacterized protein ACOB8E_024795 isoform 1-T1 [Sarcophilus harrisii]
MGIVAPHTKIALAVTPISQTRKLRQAAMGSRCLRQDLNSALPDSRSGPCPGSPNVPITLTLLPGGQRREPFRSSFRKLGARWQPDTAQSSCHSGQIHGSTAPSGRNTTNTAGGY